MTDTPKRCFFQIHLSTAIVLMILCGILLHFNFRRTEKWYAVGNGTGATTFYQHAVQGWPMPCFDLQVNSIRRPNHRIVTEKVVPPEVWKSQRWMAFPLGVNIIIAMTLLFTAVVFCEWLIRRREGRKT